MHLAILLTAAASWYLVGLAVTVGTTTYPAFAVVGDQEWPEFHRLHSARITWAVGGAWVAQAIGILWWFAGGGRGAAWWVTAVLAAAAVALTAGVAVGLHRRLTTGRTAEVLERLRRVHLVRTLIWVGAALAATAPLR